MTRLVGPARVAEAAEVLRRGGLVAFPTETVYGLGADASSAAAVESVFRAKGRPSGHPLIVHLGSIDLLDEWAVEVDPRARLLAERFWPGPLTLVLRRSARVPDVVTGGRPTVGLRVPDHPVALELLRAFEGGVAAPSANRFGHVSPTTPQHVLRDLAGRIDLVVDGGPCAVGLESTIVEVLGGPVTLLRPGGLSVERLEEALGEAVVDDRDGDARAPGMLTSHYAPRARVEVVPPEQVQHRLAELGATSVGVVSAGPLEVPAGVFRWQLPVDADGFAARLYAVLREADVMAAEHVLVVPPQEGSLAKAVEDRLHKAAAPRSEPS
jgi:L-threonylcarbamoyladenylate synthase